MVDSSLQAIAQRIARIQPFYVMEILARAKALEAQGRHIIHMEVGEPDFLTPEPIISAGRQALDSGQMFYTPALGLPELRKYIAEYYGDSHHRDVDPQSVVVTTGASGALLLALGVILDPGEQVLMTDPGYPCNRHFVTTLGGEAVTVAVDQQSRYQLTAELVDQHWTEKTKVVMLASPANPTGMVIPKAELLKIAQLVQARNAYLIVDEIYLGLSYDITQFSAVGLNPRTIVINSFSKYFGMTGWRLGWLVCDTSLVGYIDTLAQNIFLAPPTISQHAALAAFSEESRVITEHRRDVFRQRRDYLYTELGKLGFKMTDPPDGAFYLYVSCEKFSTDSSKFCQELLHQTGVAITPGRDFGSHEAETHLRFAYTTSMESLQEGIARLADFLAK